MKAWLGLLGIGAIGFGIGFFAGERYGRAKAEESPPEPAHIQVAKKEPVTDKDVAEYIAKKEGYVSDEDMDDTVQRMDEYLSGFEHPEEDDDQDDMVLKEYLTPPNIPGTDKNEIEVFLDVDRWDAETEYDCHELYYYEEDEVVSDEDDHRIEDYEELIGENTIQQMNDLGVLVIFARNNWTESVYKITRIQNSYGRLVLGLDDCEVYKQE